MPQLLGSDQLVNNAPRTAKAAMERAMRQICPNINSSLLDNFFNGIEAVEQYADGVEESFTGNLSMVKTDNGWQETADHFDPANQICTSVLPARGSGTPGASFFVEA